MATTGRKYPTEVGVNTDSWTDPENMLNAGDGSCGLKVTTAYEWLLKCYLKTYGFAIPAGSTITKLTLGVNACRKADYVNFAGIALRLINGDVTYLSSLQEKAGESCADCGERTLSFEPPIPMPTVEDLNNETFTTDIEFWGSSIYMLIKRAWVDDVWIEVEYTPPAAPSGIMDGLVQAD